MILISFSPCATPLEVRWGEVRWESGDLPSHSTPEAELGGRAVAYNFSTGLNKCYLSRVKLWRKWECLQQVPSTLLCSAGALQYSQQQCKHFLMSPHIHLTCSCQGHISPRDKGPFSILPFCVSDQIRKWSGQHPHGRALLTLNWTYSGQWIPHQFLYKHQVDDSLSQQSRMTLETLLRCTSTFLSYINFNIYI